MGIKKAGKKRYLVLWAIFVFLVFVCTTVTNKSAPTAVYVGSFIGSLIGAIGIAGLIVYFIGGIYWLIKRKRMVGMTPTILILASVMLVSVIALRLSEKQALDLPPGLVDDMAKLSTGIDDRRFDEEGFAVEDPQPIDTEAKYTGDLGKIELVARLSSERERKLSNSYLRDLEEIGWNSILDPNRLENDSGLADSKLILSRSNRALALYLKRANDNANRLENEMNAIEYSSEDTKKNALSGFYRTFDRTKEQRKEILQMEVELVESVGRLISILDQSYGYWSVEDGNLVMEDDNYLKAYNDEFRNFDLVAAKQSALTNLMRLEQAKRVERLRQ